MSSRRQPMEEFLGKNGNLSSNSPGRKIVRPETHRLISAIDTAFGIVRRPSARILKQADRANSPFFTQIKPVPRSARHAQQIPRFNGNRNHFSVAVLTPEVNVKNSPALDDEPHFIFIVPVFAVASVQ